MLLQGVRWIRLMGRKYQNALYLVGVIALLAFFWFIRSNYLHAGDISTALQSMFSAQGRASSAEQQADRAACGSGEPRRKDLAFSRQPELRALGELDKLCNGRSADRSLHFIALPSDAASAGAVADSLVYILKDYAAAGVRPVIVAEPSRSLTTDRVTFYSSDAGAQAVAQLLGTLQAKGITAAMIGDWVLLPESNTPAWGDTTPAHFAGAYTALAAQLQRFYPSAETYVLLDAKSYQPGDTTWATGSYASLIPYIDAIPRGFIDMIGMQGFPWVPRPGAAGKSTVAAREYLPLVQLLDAARHTQTQRIWVNTGVPASYYASSERPVRFSPEQRNDMLGGVVEQLQSQDRQAVAVTLSLFAQDKSGAGEDIDWSFRASQPEDVATLTETISTVRSIGKGDIWYFAVQQ